MVVILFQSQDEMTTDREALAQKVNLSFALFNSTRKGVSQAHISIPIRSLYLHALHKRLSTSVDSRPFSVTCIHLATILHLFSNPQLAHRCSSLHDCRRASTGG